MKIYIDQIPEAGLELSETCEPATLDLGRTDIKFTEPFNLFAQVTKGGNNIAVQMQINATMHLNCGRCLGEFTLPVRKKIALNFTGGDKQVIDLTDNLREELILGYPLKPLCRSDCLGLCPICGKNLNKGKCKCQPLPREAKGKKHGFTKTTSF